MSMRYPVSGGVLLFVVLTLTGVSSVHAEGPHPRQVQTEDWEGCKKCGPDCKGHGLTPADPEFYTRRVADLTPVGVWAPVLAGCLLFTLFAVGLRQRVRRQQLRTRQ